MRRTTWVAATFVMLTTTLAACGGSGEESGQDDTTSTTANEESAVLDAYEASWQAFIDASANPVNPHHPALTETMTGDALANATAALQEMADAAEYIEGPPVDLSPRVRELSANRAVIDDCVDEQATRYAADGTVLMESDSTPATVEAVMLKENGIWKNSELTKGEPCDP